MSNWTDVPNDTMLSLKRQSRAGLREQWAVVRREGALILERASPEEGIWRESGSFGTIREVLASSPELRELRKGVVSFFQLTPEADINVRDFAALLELCPQEGSDDPGDWPLAQLDASGWEDLEFWRQASDLPLIRRLASVNDLQISGIDAGNCVPVLANEDGFAAADIVAQASTHAHVGVSMVGWDGGSNLVMLAPGLACSVPWGDEVDSGDNGFLLVDFAEQGRPEEVAAALAEWLTSIGFDFWAALALEPLDPDGILDDQGREAWAEFEHGMLTVSPALRVPAGIEPLLRAALAGLSDSYARTAEARANPAGPVAQVMLASGQADLHYGSWIRKL